MEEFRLMNEAAAANNANASIESDITDFGDLAIADAARPQVGVVPRACGGGNAQREWLGCTPCHWMTARLLLATFFKGLYHATCHNPGNQVAANLAANVGVDAEAFLNNETIRQDLAADEDRTGRYDAIRLQGIASVACFVGVAWEPAGCLVDFSPAPHGVRLSPVCRDPRASLGAVLRSGLCVRGCVIVHPRHRRALCSPAPQSSAPPPLFLLPGVYSGIPVHCHGGCASERHCRGTRLC